MRNTNKLREAAPDMAAALKAILFQVVQGKVLERDACITQARAALVKAGVLEGGQKSLIPYLPLGLMRITLRLDQFGPALQADCGVASDDDLIHEAVRAFAKHAPCTVQAFKRDESCAWVGTVELTVEGKLK